MNRKLSPIKAVRKPKATTLKECGGCPALCCHDLSITILKPSNRKEIEDLKWHLNYDTVAVYIANRRWHVLVKGRCRNLDAHNLCTIYEDRFDKCRNHMPPHCERYEDWYDVIFHTPDELENHLRKKPKKST